MATLTSRTTLKVGDSPQERTPGGHVRFAVTNNRVYEAFGKTALIPGCHELWTSVVMPNITFFTLLLAVFEMTTTHPAQGQIRQNRLSGQCTVQFIPRELGHASPQAGWKADVLVNRLPNLLFALPQLPLCWVISARVSPSFWALGAAS